MHVTNAHSPLRPRTTSQEQAPSPPPAPRPSGGVQTPGSARSPDVVDVLLGWTAGGPVAVPPARGAPLLDRAKNLLIADFRFAQGADGGLSPRAAAPFAGAIDDTRLAALANGTATPRVLPFTEAELGDTKATVAFFKRAGQFGELTSEVRAADGRPVKIRYGAFLPPDGVPIRAVLNLNSGRTECMLTKYCETIYALRELIAAGVAVVMNDHRGQGFSDRILPDADKGHVEAFSDYTKDVDTFTQRMRAQLAPRLASDATWTIAGHSMGGGIVARYLEEYAGKHPYSSAFGLSPMLGVQVVPKNLAAHLPLPLERAVEGLTVDVLDTVGGSRFLPGTGGYAAGDFDGNTLTGSRARFAQTTTLEDAYRPLQLGGPTAHWAAESVAHCRKMVADASKIGIPFTILRSADDRIVNVREQDAFAAASGSEVISFQAEPGQLPIGHELLQERDQVRNQVLDLLTAPLIEQLRG